MKRGVKRGLRIFLGLILLTALSLIGIAVWFHFFRSVDSQREFPRIPPSETVRISAVGAALVESPDACRVMVVGDEAEDYLDFFNGTGLTLVEAQGDNEADIIFVSSLAGAPTLAALRERLAINGILAYHLSVKDKSVKEVYDELSMFPTESRVHLWMPGAHDWLVVERAIDSRVSADDIAGVFTYSGFCLELVKIDCDSLPRIFASYVGTFEEIMPAFGGLNPTEGILPENLVPQDVIEAKWITTEGFDPKLLSTLKTEMRSAQNVRRMILRGNVASQSGDTKSAFSLWGQAAKLNPSDPMLKERVEHLRTNAEVFVKLAKFGNAAKCFETIVVIDPMDVDAVRNLGHCYQMLGQTELAKQVFARSEQILKIRSSSLKKEAK